jgi:hypothetical protein
MCHVCGVNSRPSPEAHPGLIDDGEMGRVDQNDKNDKNDKTITGGGVD